MASLGEAIASESDEHLLRAKADDLAGQLGAARKALAESEHARSTAELVAEYSSRPLKPPKWLTRAPKKGERKAVLCSILSDMHFDECVNPAEIEGRNKYDRNIAEQRLERYFLGVVKMARHYLAGLTYEGVVLFMAGDSISGDIHEELAESNEGTTLETVLFWVERLAAGIELLADEFGSVHIPCVVGNHGRRTRKPRSKRRARDNFDWLIAQMLARHFHSDARVTFQIPDGTDAIVPVYDTTFCLTHGDQTSGGGGIGGIWPPLMRLIAKKRSRHDFDTMVCGHWHSLIMAPDAGIICNGSLKGPDEWSLGVMNFSPERPQQALFTVAPGMGVTFSAPVLVEDRVREGW